MDILNDIIDWLCCHWKQIMEIIAVLLGGFILVRKIKSKQIQKAGDNSKQQQSLEVDNSESSSKNASFIGF